MTEPELAAARAVPCPICLAKPGEMCASLVDASKNYETTVHSRRRELARKGTP